MKKEKDLIYDVSIKPDGMTMKEVLRKAKEEGVIVADFDKVTEKANKSDNKEVSDLFLTEENN